MSEQKIEQFWRDATAEDVARVMKGEKVEARFRDDTCDKWKVAMLGGYGAMSEGFNWIDIDGDCYAQCQVYEPPLWYLDKPDPGEGWRLLEKFPAESLQPGDEWFEPDPLEAGWKVSHNERQANFLWYRRRIEPVPQSVGSRSKDYIPTGWTKLSDDEPRLATDAFWSLGANDWVIIGDSRVEYANRDKWPAIRLHDANLVQGRSYFLPSGLTLEVYKNGFEVF